jgi:hypothetical protein
MVQWEIYLKCFAEYHPAFPFCFSDANVVFYDVRILLLRYLLPWQKGRCASIERPRSDSIQKAVSLRVQLSNCDGYMRLFQSSPFMKQLKQHREPEACYRNSGLRALGYLP